MSYRQSAAAAAAVSASISTPGLRGRLAGHLEHDELVVDLDLARDVAQPDADGTAAAGPACAWRRRSPPPGRQRARRPSRARRLGRAGSPRARAHDGAGVRAAPRDGLVADVDHLHADAASTALTPRHGGAGDAPPPARRGSRPSASASATASSTSSAFERATEPSGSNGLSSSPTRTQPPTRRRRRADGGRRGSEPVRDPAELPRAAVEPLGEAQEVLRRPGEAVLGLGRPPSEREVHPRRLGEQAVLVQRSEIGQSLERRARRAPAPPPRHPAPRGSDAPPRGGPAGRERAAPR